MIPFAGATADAVASQVRDGTVYPVEVLRAHLAQVAALDARVGAFQLIRADKAVAEAQALAARAEAVAERTPKCIVKNG